MTTHIMSHVLKKIFFCSYQQSSHENTMIEKIKINTEFSGKPLSYEYILGRFLRIPWRL